MLAQVEQIREVAFDMDLEVELDGRARVIRDLVVLVHATADDPVDGRWRALASIWPRAVTSVGLVNSNRAEKGSAVAPLSNTGGEPPR